MSTSDAYAGDNGEASASRKVAGQMRALRIALGVGTVALGVVALFWPGVWPDLALLTFTALGGWLLVIFGVMTTVSGLGERSARTRSESMREGGSTAATA
jgi:uncharacterized membrane protein HdeD (DUF308 family)